MWKDLELIDDEFAFLPTFKNVTTQISEPICLSTGTKISTGCLIKEQNLNKIDLTNDLTPLENEWAELTIGCRKCDVKNGFYGIVETNPALGIIT